MGTAAQGAQAKMAVDTALPFDTSSLGFEFISESIKKTEVIRRTDGFRGTRSHNYVRRRRESAAVSGQLVMHPGVAEMDFFLPFILGGTTSGGTTPLAETLTTFYIMIDRVTKVFTYDVRVNKATLEGSAGAPLTLTLDLEGFSETVGNSGTFPAVVAIPDANQYIFPDLTMTINSVAVPVKRLRLVIDNMLDTGRYMNTTARTQLVPKDRLVTLGLDVGYTSDETQFYTQALAGVAAAIAMNNGTSTYTWTLANIHGGDESPTVGAKEEIMLPLNYVCERTVAAAELSVAKS